MFLLLENTIGPSQLWCAPRAEKTPVKPPILMIVGSNERPGDTGKPTGLRAEELAAHHYTPGWHPFAIRDGQLPTGQSPASSRLAAQQPLDALGAREPA